MRCRVLARLGKQKLAKAYPTPEAPAILWDKLQLGVSSSDAHSGGASPLWAVMTGTIRLGKGVRREAESEESR